MWPFKKKKKEEQPPERLTGDVPFPGYPFTPEQARGMGGMPQFSDLHALATQGQRWATPTLTAQAMAQQRTLNQLMTQQMEYAMATGTLKFAKQDPEGVRVVKALLKEIEQDEKEG